MPSVMKPHCGIPEETDRFIANNPQLKARYQQYVEFFKGLWHSEYDAIMSYTGDSYLEINTALRERGTDPAGDLILAAIKRAPVLDHDTVLFRAVSGKYRPPIGINVPIHGIMSTTTDAKMFGSPFEGDSVVLIIFPVNIRGIPWNELLKMEVMVGGDIVADEEYKIGQYKYPAFRVTLRNKTCS